MLANRAGSMRMRSRSTPGRGDERICALAEYAGQLLVKDQGASAEFVAPAEGLLASPLLCGVADCGPRPEAARRFIGG
jgi:iron(III) transport system substrate-binding protein